MMFRHSISILLLTLVTPTLLYSQTKAASAQPAQPDTIYSSLRTQYENALQFLADQRDTANVNAVPAVVPDAYLFQILLSPTLYSSPVRQMMGQTTTSGDTQELRLEASNRALARLYTENPALVEQTEDMLREQGKLREDITEKIHTEDQLSTKVGAATLKPETDEKAEVKTRRPNFWKFPGGVGVNFNQWAYSDNWPGGEDRYSGLFTFNVNAKYNNEKKFYWDNNLDFRLGFQTSKTDKNRTFRPTDNKIEYNTQAGLKAYKTLSYTVKVRLYTKVVPNYSPNTDKVYEDILSPLDVTIGPGMDYSFKYGKKRPFSGNINVQPLAYFIRYVQRRSLVTRYGIHEGHHSSHSFGPSITLNYEWPIVNQVRWKGKVYWFSNLHKTYIDWSNTFSFNFYKYFNANLYIHTPYDDQVRSDKGMRLEENLGIGMSYNF